MVFSLCARVGWCDICTEFTNLIKVDVDVNEMPLSNIWHARGLYVSHIFLTDMCLFCWQKCKPRPKLFLRLDIFSTFRGLHTPIFTYVPYIVICLHEEAANFYREKGSVALVTGYLFTFLVVLSLIGLVNTQILICANQIIWRLEIISRTIVASLLKIKWQLCLKQKISRNRQGIFHNSANDRERWWLIIFCC